MENSYAWKARIKWEAKKAGLKRYKTGEACQRGHLAERFVSTGTCCECHKLHNKKSATVSVYTVKHKLYHVDDVEALKAYVMALNFERTGRC